MRLRSRFLVSLAASLFLAVTIAQREPQDGRLLKFPRVTPSFQPSMAPIKKFLSWESLPSAAAGRIKTME